MVAERLRCLSASPWLDGAIGVAATVAIWIELLGQPGHRGAGRPSLAGELGRVKPSWTGCGPSCVSTTST